MPDLTQDERLVYLYTIVGRQINPIYPNIHPIKTVVVESDEEFEQLTMEWIDEGYEGGILRDKDSLYYFGGRRNNMYKLKKPMIEEFLILDVVPYHKQPDIGMFRCKNNITNDIFDCATVGDNTYRSEILTTKNKNIGKNAVIRFFERSKNQLPFHGNVIEVI